VAAKRESAAIVAANVRVSFIDEFSYCVFD
jgi:hypothetical protein